jgi:polysaccharide biosynthesis protein PelF
MFKSFVQGGFECSSHRRRDGRRLDLIAATRHDAQAHADYKMLADAGLLTIRDGLRWHLIDRGGQYDFSSAIPMLEAGQRAGVEIIWDLFHYGWPDDLDIFSPAFLKRFEAYAEAATRIIRQHSSGTLFITPVNEISFLSWAGGSAGVINPCRNDCGMQLKEILVKAALAATRAIWRVDAAARILHVDPMINPMPEPGNPTSVGVALSRENSQFEAWDMLCGRLNPEWGGDDKYLDVIGINYYPHNQWIENRGPIHWTAGAYVPLRHLLMDNYRRYGRPILIAETGIEAAERPAWFRYVCQEVRMALAMGIPVQGICLYPVMNHPGWEDERHCPNGLLDYDRETFARSYEEPLRQEMLEQQWLFASDSIKETEALRPLSVEQTLV